MGLIDTGVIPFQQVVVHAANRLLSSGQGDVESWLCISGDESMTISKIINIYITSLRILVSHDNPVLLQDRKITALSIKLLN